MMREYEQLLVAPFNFFLFLFVFVLVIGGWKTLKDAVSYNLL